MPELEIAIRTSPGSGMKFELLGEHILVAQIVAEAGERGRIVEGERAKPAVLGKIDSQVAGDPALPPLPMKMILLPASCASWAACAPTRSPIRGSAFRDRSVTSAAAHGIGQRADIFLQQFPHYVPGSSII